MAVLLGQVRENHSSTTCWHHDLISLSLSRVEGPVVSFGTGQQPGESLLLSWQNTKKLLVGYVGFSSWNTPIQYRNIRIF